MGEVQERANLKEKRLQEEAVAEKAEALVALRQRVRGDILMAVVKH